MLTVDRTDFTASVDRVSTISSERGRAVKLSLTDGRLVLSVTNPDSGSAVEEVQVDYEGAPLDIGFNARYSSISPPSSTATRRCSSWPIRLANHHPGP